MNESSFPTIEDRRRRLALTCELDRLRLRIVVRRATRPPAAAPGGVPLAVVNNALSFAQFVPGRIGRWARGAVVGSDLMRMIAPFLR